MRGRALLLTRSTCQACTVAMTAIPVAAAILLTKHAFGSPCAAVSYTLYGLVVGELGDQTEQLMLVRWPARMPLVVVAAALCPPHAPPCACRLPRVQDQEPQVSVAQFVEDYFGYK